MFATVRIRVAVLDLGVAVCREEVEPRPGAETTFAALRAAGVRVCLTTGLHRGMLDHVVDVLGWRDQLDLTLAPDADEGLRAPPYPDFVLAAALRLQADDVREVAVAADTHDDLVAAARAGASVRAAVLQHAPDETTLRNAPYTHVLGTIDDFPAAVAAGAYSAGGAM
jgi:phosphoglycolate phosphatase-like HAD superfamily hydrolase